MATVLPQGVNVGTVVSSSQAWAAGKVGAVATGIMSDADAADPTVQMTLYISASYDPQGLTFTRESGFGWQGGPNGGNAAPYISWNPDPAHLPLSIRVEADLTGRSVSVGFDLTQS